MENNTDMKKGLSGDEAAFRLKTHGPNRLPEAEKKSVFKIAFEVVREPMFLLLVACGTLYLILGDIEEALMLLGFVFVVMGITFYQERKTERALEALRDLSSPRALVIRDSVRIRVPGSEVVPGDLVVLSEGDRVPADGIVVECGNLSVDESLLTGESVSVRKTTGSTDADMGKPGGDNMPFVFSGTLIVSGHGLALIKKTGIETEIGKIGKALSKVELENTLLQKETSYLVRNIAVIGVILCAAVFVIFGLTRQDWIKGFLAGLSLAMAMLPEEFPVVLTIFFALGAWRLSKVKVLARRVPVIETLGSATVLCVDKTGTLTQNMMKVKKIYTRGKMHDVEERVPANTIEAVFFGAMACQKDPFDPMEKAFKELLKLGGPEAEGGSAEFTEVRHYPISNAMLAVTYVLKDKKGGLIAAAKGAPEAVAKLCGIKDEKLKVYLSTVSEMANEGMRVIGIAKAVPPKGNLPETQDGFEFELLGLAGLADPVRPSVKGAVQECYSAGIRVVMITGDYAGTAKCIAGQIGLKNHDIAITGEELEKMNDDELSVKIKVCNIFARVVPEQKLKLVKALKANGEIVAMTGDGVNDAPALKSAHIGISMGGRGTDVAREASSMVLLEDDFSSIVQAVRMGRRIFENIKKALSYIISVHVPIAGLSLIPVIFKWPLILMPVHIVFLELIIDPACSTVFEGEAEEKDSMKKPPRDRTKKVFGAAMIGAAVCQGLAVMAVILCVMFISGRINASEEESRAMAFTTLVVANMGLILTNLSRTRNIFEIAAGPNKTKWWILSGAAVMLAAVLCVPFLRELFRFGKLHAGDVLLCVAAGAASIMIFEILKIVQGRKMQKT